MAKKQIIYMHKASGNIKICRTDLEGQLLGEEWIKLQFTKNKQGKPIMRADFGDFIMDVSENGEKEVVTSGNRSAK